MKYVIQLMSAAVLGLTVGGSLCAAQDIASVNGQSITLADVQAKLLKTPLILQMSEEKAGQIVSQLITSELLAQQAVRVGLDKQDAVVEQIEKATRPAIINAMKQKIKSEKHTDDYVKQYYADHLDDFRSVKISQIQVDNEAKARDIHSQLKSGADFAELAKKNSLHALSREQGGDLGYVRPGTTPKAFENVAFSLPVGQISEPIETDLGYHIIKVIDAQTPKKFYELNEAAIAEIKNKIYGEEIQRLRAGAKVEMYLERLESAPLAGELARIDDKVITAADYKNTPDKITKDNVAFYSTPTGRAALLGELVADELLYREGLRRGFDQDKAVLLKAGQARRDALAEAMQEKIKTEELDNDELQKYYAEYPNYFGGIRVSHILVDTEDQAKDLYQEIIDGADFGALAEKHSKDEANSARGGDLGYITVGARIDRNFQDMAFSLKLDEVSQPVQTGLGYHLIKVTALQKPKKFEDLAQPELDIVRRQKYEDMLKHLAETTNAVIEVKPDTAKDIVARFNNARP